MKSFAFLLSTALAAPLILFHTASDSVAQAASAQRAIVDLTGRWQLNPDLSDARPKPPQAGDDAAQGREGQPRRRPGGGSPGGGGFPGGGGGGGGRGGRGGMGPGDRPNPESMAKMRDAMQFVLEAPDEMIVTRHDDELVFTAGSGDITRILVTGKNMKTTAGGAEHDYRAAYKDDTLVVESTFGPMKVVDTYRVSTDGAQLERVTKVEAQREPRGGGEAKPLRRVYDRVR